MRKFIITILLRLLGRTEYHKVSQEESADMLKRLSKDEDYDRLPAFLEQCADQFRNRYLYTGEEMYKGSVLAFVELRSRLERKKMVKPKKIKKNLTKDGNSGKIVTY